MLGPALFSCWKTRVCLQPLLKKRRHEQSWVQGAAGCRTRLPSGSCAAGHSAAGLAAASSQADPKGETPKEGHSRGQLPLRILNEVFNTRDPTCVFVMTVLKQLSLNSLHYNMLMLKCTQTSQWQGRCCFTQVSDHKPPGVTVSGQAGVFTLTLFAGPILTERDASISLF